MGPSRPAEMDNPISQLYGFDPYQNTRGSNAKNLRLPGKQDQEIFEEERDLNTTLNRANRVPTNTEVQATDRRFIDKQRDNEKEWQSLEGLGNASEWRDETQPVLDDKYNIKLPKEVLQFKNTLETIKRLDPGSDRQWIERNLGGPRERAVLQAKDKGAQLLRESTVQQATNYYEKTQKDLNATIQIEVNLKSERIQLMKMLQMSDLDPAQKKEFQDRLDKEINPTIEAIEKMKRTQMESLYELNGIIGEASNDVQGSVEVATKEFYNNSVSNVPRLAGSLVSAVDALVKAPQKWAYDAILESSNIDSPTIKGYAAYKLGQMEVSDIAIESMYGVMADASKSISLDVDVRPQREMARLTGQTLGQLAQMTAVSAIAGPAAGMTVGAALSADEMMSSAIDAGLDFEDAALLAGLYAPLGTVLEYYGASRGIAALEKVSLRKFIMDQVLTGKVPITKKGVTQAIKGWAGENLKQSGEEAITESTQFMLQDLMQRGYDQLQKEDGPRFNNPEFFESQFNNSLGASAGGGAYAGFLMQAITGIFGARKRNFKTFANSIQTEEGYQRVRTQVELGLKKNGVDQKEVDRALVQLQTARGLVQSIPKNYSESDQIQWFNSAMQKADIDIKRENIPPASRKTAFKEQEAGQDQIMEELDQKYNEDPPIPTEEDVEISPDEVVGPNPTPPSVSDNKVSPEVADKAMELYAKNKNGLKGVLAKIFGLTDKKAAAVAEVYDAVIGNAAKREGTSKEGLFERIRFRRANKAPDGSLKQSAPGPESFEGEEGERNYQRWKGENREVAYTEVQEVKNGEGVVIRAYHGTTNDFYEFDASVKGNIEGHLGKVNYFTTDEGDASGNYQSDGADLTNRIGQRAEQIDQDLADHGIVMLKSRIRFLEDADVQMIEERYGVDLDNYADNSLDELPQILAKEELMGNDEKVLDVYVKLNNPVVLGNTTSWAEVIPEPSSEAMSDAAEEIAEEYDITAEEAMEDYNYEVRDRAMENEGLTNLAVEALQNAIDDNVFDSSREISAAEILADNYYDEAVDLIELEKLIREKLGDAMNEDGDMSASQIVADFFEYLGYDGIILTDVSERFRGMNLGSGTSHVHVFDQYANQIKLADGTNTKFGNSKDIRFQGDQGAMMVEDSNYVIYALTDPNVSTPLHEIAHVYEHYLNPKERQKILQWLGKDQWDTEASEGFARGFEKYLVDGKAPNDYLQNVFEKFKKWLTDIYNGITNSDIDLELNEDMKAIYDVMVGGDGLQTASEGKSVFADAESKSDEASNEAAALRDEYFKNVGLKPWDQMTDDEKMRASRMYGDRYVIWKDSKDDIYEMIDQSNYTDFEKSRLKRSFDKGGLTKSEVEQMTTIDPQRLKDGNLTKWERAQLAGREKQGDVDAEAIDFEETPSDTGSMTEQDLDEVDQLVDPSEVSDKINSVGGEVKTEATPTETDRKTESIKYGRGTYNVETSADGTQRIFNRKGKEILPMTTRKLKDGSTKKVKNPIHAKVLALANNELTDNEINAERMKKINSFEPMTERQLVLDAFSRGARVDETSVQKETGEKAGMMWATGMVKKGTHPTVEQLAEKLMEDALEGLPIEEDVLRDEIIDVLTSYSSLEGVRDEILQNIDENSGMEADLEYAKGLMTEQELAMYESIEAEEGLANTLDDKQLEKYYEQQFDKQIESLPNEERNALIEQIYLDYAKPTTESEGTQKVAEESSVQKGQAEKVKQQAYDQIDQVADFLKDALGIDLPPGTKKKGIDQDALIDLVANAAKALVSKGVDLAQAIKQVIAKLKPTGVLDQFNEKEIVDGATKKAQGQSTPKKTPSKKATPPPKTPKQPKGKKKEPSGRKKRYLNRLVDHVDDGYTERRIKELGLNYLPQTWEKIEPLAQEILDAALASTNPQAAFNQIEVQIKNTTNLDYENNPHLATLHSILYHKIIAHFYKTGDTDNFVKWGNSYDNAGRYRGQFIAAMQEASTPEAIANRVINSTVGNKNEAVERNKAEIDEIQKLLKLSEKERKELEKKLEEALKDKEGKTKPAKPPAEPATPKPEKQQKESQSKEAQHRRKVKSGLSKIRLGIKKLMGQANAGVPINQEIIEGVRELIEGLVGLGFYKADQIRKKVYNTLKEELGKKNADNIMSDENWNKIYNRDMKDMAEEEMRADFLRKVEKRFKGNIKPNRKQKLDPLEVLLRGLISKVDETVKKPKESEAAKAQRTFDQVRTMIENREFSDEVWQEAIENVQAWLETQYDLDPRDVQRIMHELEQSAALFMDQPMASALMARAIRLGEKTMDETIADIIKKHPFDQSQYAFDLAEKIIRMTGVSNATADYLQEVYFEAVREYMEQTKLKELRKKLGLDKNGNPINKADHKNKSVYESIIESINMGALTNAQFQDHFAEKFGFSKLGAKDVAFIKAMVDLIYNHSGGEMSVRYKKKLMDYLETMRPNNAYKITGMMYSLAIKSALTGVSTIGVNIPIGSMYSYWSNMLVKIVKNPRAALEFERAYKKAGLKGTGIQSFLDIMGSGFNVLDEGYIKFEELSGQRGDWVDGQIAKGLGPYLKEFKKAKDPAARAKAMSKVAAQAYLKVYQLANYANAFDAVMSHKGAERIAYLEAFSNAKADAKRSGKARGNLIEQARQKAEETMGYHLAEKAQIQVEQEIELMRARGESIPRGYEKRRKKEIMAEQRPEEMNKVALDTVKHFALMNAPNGMFGMFYEWYTRQFSVKETDSGLGAIAKTGVRLVTGMFFRISIVFAQRAFENIPIVSLGLPGIFYEVASKRPDSNKPEKKTWQFMKRNPPHVIKQKLSVHAAVTAAFGLAMANMFDEDDEGNTILNPDRIIDITGPGDKFWNEEQLNSGTETDKQEFKPYTLYMKLNDKWIPMVPARLLPQAQATMAIIGGMRDDIMYNGFKQGRELEREFSDQKRKERGLPPRPNDKDLEIEGGLGAKITSVIDDIYLSTAEQSFNSSVQGIKKISQADGFGDTMGEMFKVLARPAKTMLYPNILRDSYKEVKAATNQPDLTGDPFISAFANDVVLLDLLMMDKRHDAFGFEVKQASPLAETLRANLVTNAAQVVMHDEFKQLNIDRFQEKAWRLKQQHPDVIVREYYNTKVPYEERMKLKEYCGTYMAMQSENKYELLKGMESISYKLQMDAFYSGGKIYANYLLENHVDLIDKLTQEEKQDVARMYIENGREGVELELNKLKNIER